MHRILTRIYPEATIKIENEIITIRGFRYYPNGVIILDELSQDYEIDCIDGNLKLKYPSIQVEALSEPHPGLVEAFDKLSLYQLVLYLQFAYRSEFDINFMTLNQFNTELINQRKIYKYLFLDRDSQYLYLCHKLKTFFRASIPHDTHCWLFHDVKSEPNDHVCNLNLHLHFLLQSIHYGSDQYRITQNHCLGMVHPIYSGILYIHISPGGSLVGAQQQFELGINMGQGTCSHPLVRILFWKMLLQKRPDLMSLFESYYLRILKNDLHRRLFTPTKCENLEMMISEFNTSICIECSIPAEIRSFNLSSFGEQTIERPTCSHTNHYLYPLLLLGILKNGWHHINGNYICCFDYRDRIVQIINTPTQLTYNDIQIDPIIRDGLLRYFIPTLRQ